MTQVTFVSSNKNKFHEANAILSALGIEVGFADIKISELQSDSLEEIAREKAKSAFALVGRPVIVEDDGLFINSLNGFPGPYSSYVFETIGNEGILKLLAGPTDGDAEGDRSGSFRSVIAYFDGSRMSVSRGIVEGRISENITAGGWGYDPIFIPTGSSLTFAQLGKEKDSFSHRRIGLEKFADWLRLQSKA